jgi:hypothetical protein
MTLDELEVEGRERERLRAAIEAVARRMLLEHPIYRLSGDRSAKEARALKHLRRLFVERGKLVVEYTM